MFEAHLPPAEAFYSFGRVEVGNGERCCVWVDHWLPRGPILGCFVNRVIFDATSSVEARVADFLKVDGDWRWLVTSHFLLELEDHVQSVQPYAHQEDQIVWFPNRSKRFSVAYAYEALRPQGCYCELTECDLVWG